MFNFLKKKNSEDAIDNSLFKYRPTISAEEAKEISNRMADAKINRNKKVLDALEEEAKSIAVILSEIILGEKIPYSIIRGSSGTAINIKDICWDWENGYNVDRTLVDELKTILESKGYQVYNEPESTWVYISW